MAKTVTNDVETLRRYLVAEGLDAVAPTLPELTASQERALADGDDAAVAEFFTHLRPALVRQDRWEQHLPDWYATRYSYGLQHKRQIRERYFKRAFPETINLRVDGEVRALADGQLVELLAALGVLPQADVIAAETTQQPALAAAALDSARDSGGLRDTSDNGYYGKTGTTPANLAPEQTDPVRVAADAPISGAQDVARPSAPAPRPPAARPTRPAPVAARGRGTLTASHSGTGRPSQRGKRISNAGLGGRA